jgi:hypothetical protein
VFKAVRLSAVVITHDCKHWQSSGPVLVETPGIVNLAHVIVVACECDYVRIKFKRDSPCFVEMGCIHAGRADVDLLRGGDEQGFLTHRARLLQEHIAQHVQRLALFGFPDGPDVASLFEDEEPSA